jgi:hypothetical protein
LSWKEKSGKGGGGARETEVLNGKNIRKRKEGGEAERKKGRREREEWMKKRGTHRKRGDGETQRNRRNGKQVGERTYYTYSIQYSVQAVSKKRRHTV